MSAPPDIAALLDQFDPGLLEIEADAVECERDLITFLERAWPHFDPEPFQRNWHHEAIADHLMAVTDGEIPKLLINVPYRCTKTHLVSTCWPLWTWAQRERGPLSGPQVRFLCVSYAAELSVINATTSRKLLDSEWYQERWGHRVEVAKRQDTKDHFDTTAGGSRISLGMDGSMLGKGGAVRIIDDPHKVKEVESDLVRKGVCRTYDESIRSRFTDPRSAATVIIMQRLHGQDLSGYVLEKEAGFVHLMLPLEYDPRRHCVTVLGWQDPRGLGPDGEMLPGLTDDGKLLRNSPLAKREGMLLWPERFTPDVVEECRAAGPYAYAAQCQQAPTPRGGGIIKDEWWRVWPHDDFPDFNLVVVSLDTASTEKEQNDESGMTVWGTFPTEGGLPNVMLKDGWEGRLEFNPLIEKIAETCRKHKADILLIEAANNGHAVEQEIRRQYGTREWMTILYPAKGDKVSRLTSVQGHWSGDLQRTIINNPATGTQEVFERWSGGIIWAPNKDYAQLVIDRVSGFPKGPKGIVDTVSQAIKWMRDQGILYTPIEHEEERTEERRYKKPRRPRYDV